MPVGGSIPCWKRHTKGQWLAWIAARLWWVLDAFYVTLFPTHHSPARRRCLMFWSREWRRLSRDFAPAALFSGSGASSILSFSNTRLHADYLTNLNLSVLTAGRALSNSIDIPANYRRE